MSRLQQALVAAFAVGVLAVPAASRSAAHPGRLVFIRDGHLAFMRGDGSGERTTRLAAFGFPVWSPDGRRVAFTVRSRRSRILTVDGNGRRLRALTPPRAYDCIWVAWSPNGRKLAYTRNGGCEGGLAISVVNRDGTGRRYLVGGGSISPGGTAAYDPVWSRDGRTILFGGAARDGLHLYTMSAAGHRRHRVPRTRPAAPGGLPERPVAVWSRDGRRIFYLADDDAHLHVVGRTGAGRRDLTPTLDPVREFALSPDGRRVAVVAAGNIYVLAADGSELRRVAAPPRGGAYHDPRWSPDGSRIAFAGGPGRSQIYVMNADGSGLTNLSRSDTNDDAPDWAPR